MSKVSVDMTRIFVRELEGVLRELELFPDEASVWQTAPGITNSAGNLTLHLAGNLRHFVGAVLGGTGYVRNRPLEFSRQDVPRAELVNEIRQAITDVQRVLPSVSDETLDAVFPEKVGGATTVRTRLFLLHLNSHTGFHLGQIGYLRRAMTGDARSSGPLPVAPLGEESGAG